MNSSSDALDPTSGTRRGITAGTIALVGVVLLLFTVGLAIVLAMRGDGDGGTPDYVTITQLRADPDGYDDRSVLLRVTLEDVRSVPLLSQYALYTVRDATGSMRVLTSNGVPDVDDATAASDATPGTTDGTIELQARFHSRITLDAQLKRLAEDQLGPLAGIAVDTLLPGIDLDIIYLEHERYTLPEASPVP